MKIEKYKNRYGDEYTFTLQEDGNIKWEGNFEYFRYGMPNVYTDAYKLYQSEGGTLSIKDFKEKVHENIVDDDGNYLRLSDIAERYSSYVYSDTTKIDMVDPSGGPYIEVGSTQMGMRVIGFEKIDTGYLILTESINKKE